MRQYKAVRRNARLALYVGEISFQEFSMAMERFGLTVQPPGSRGGGGVNPIDLRGLFDRYNRDQSESMSYLEFADGLFADERQSRSADPDDGANPRLPSLTGNAANPPGIRPVRSLAHRGSTRPPDDRAHSSGIFG
jgi:hypothetical protein